MDNNKFKCPIEALSNILGKKWVFNIIWFLREDKKRFSEIQKYLEGCSRKVLSQQLDLLFIIEILLSIR
ncbi:MAG: helix-turn-helix domain-containing protein [Escherichia coli]|nr:helix-turn-helix domain-containing protein [Escherichia coli]